MVGDLYNVNTLTVSKPFLLYNASIEMYYSIVYSNGLPVGMYRTYLVNGEVNGIFSEDIEMATKLDNISSFTSSKNPARIVVGKDENIYATIGNRVYDIHKIQSKKNADIKSSVFAEDNSLEKSVIDISSGISLKKASVSLKSTPSSRYLFIGITETQGEKPWCMAYSTASIMRYKTGKGKNTISAASIMSWAYPSLSVGALLEQSLSINKAIEYANTYNIYPVYSSSTMTYPQVVEEIQAGNPLVFICRKTDANPGDSNHAIVCRGYDDNVIVPFYSIWNPWYTFYERIYLKDSNLYVAENGTQYKWKYTVYNWE